jgi:hypothetical protein
VELMSLDERLSQCLGSQSEQAVLVFAVACEEVRLLVLRAGLLTWEAYLDARALMFAWPLLCAACARSGGCGGTAVCSEIRMHKAML